MAVRPVYCVVNKCPFVTVVDTEFVFYPGFSDSQKQKSYESLHQSFLSQHPGMKILEISSKSKTEAGVLLSAFNLKIKTAQKEFSVENAFQSSKVFENGGPYQDLLDVTSRQAKKDDRLKNSGKLIGFRYFDTSYPLEPKDFFYNWLYINALACNEGLQKAAAAYNCFTDIEFNPQKSINCQAKAAAIFTGLYNNHLLKEALASKASFLNIVYGCQQTPS